MKSYDAGRVINGTYGEAWIDNDYMAEVTGLQATVSLTTTDVNQTGTLKKGTKVTGINGTGTLTMNHVRSYMINKISASIRKGITPHVTIITNLADPESFGAEKIKLIDCTFTELTLANWAAGSLGEESIPFNFSDWEVMESITVA